MSAAVAAQQQGFKDVARLPDGLPGWKQAGFPTEGTKAGADAGTATPSSDAGR